MRQGARLIERQVRRYSAELGFGRAGKGREGTEAVVVQVTVHGVADSEVFNLGADGIDNAGDIATGRHPLRFNRAVKRAHEKRFAGNDPGVPVIDGRAQNADPDGVALRLGQRLVHPLEVTG